MKKRALTLFLSCLLICSCSTNKGPSNKYLTAKKTPSEQMQIDNRKAKRKLKRVLKTPLRGKKREYKKVRKGSGHIRGNYKP